MQLGLLGKNISYSFSQKYFIQKFEELGLLNWSYSVFDIPESPEILDLFKKEKLLGFNVTIPYKQEIIKYLDDLSPEALEIGAVNTVKIEGGKRIGYNTDAIGFKESLKPILQPQHKAALILGSGGASKAVAYSLKQLGIDYKIVSRQGELHYDLLTKEVVANHLVIVNTTPVGTFPNVENCPPFPIEFLTDRHLVYDLIYNPVETKLLREAQIRGAAIKNGLEMLHLQAEAAWGIWNK